jgi:hypothetical protein
VDFKLTMTSPIKTGLKYRLEEASRKCTIRKLTPNELDVMETQLDNVGMYMFTYGSDDIKRYRSLGPTYWDLKRRIRSLAHHSTSWRTLTTPLVFDYYRYTRNTRAYMDKRKSDGTLGRSSDVQQSREDDELIHKYLKDAMELLEKLTAGMCYIIDCGGGDPEHVGLHEFDRAKFNRDHFDMNEASEEELDTENLHQQPLDIEYHKRMIQRMDEFYPVDFEPDVFGVDNFGGNDDDEYELYNIYINQQPPDIKGYNKEVERRWNIHRKDASVDRGLTVAWNG